MTQLALLSVHGMGDTERNYADPFFKDVRAAIGAERSANLATFEVYYQDILQGNQRKYFKKVQRRVDWDKLRRFMLFGFGDAAALEAQKEGSDSPYFISQTRILERFRDAYRAVGPQGKVVIVAQSLGGQVLSNYLWDARKPSRPKHGIWSARLAFESAEEEAFCRGATVVRIFTTGCNIPIFVAGRAREQIVPISMPHPAFEWHNFYDVDDVLGWPLKDLSDAYDAAVHKDHKINAGVFAGFSPLSHSRYWTDRNFLKPIKTHLTRLMRD